MKVETVKAWADVGMLILTHGLTTFSGIKAMIKAANPGVTDEELNTIVRAVQDDAKRRKAVSDAIVADWRESV